jgi:GNAT superfamily N-acetyltransferase
MVRNLVPDHQFAIRRAEGEIVAVGMAVVEQGWMGAFDIIAAPGRRRQGHGTAVMNDLLRWASRSGARNAYLQVTQSNIAAHALYAQLGFREAYTYWYRIKDV